MNAGDSHVDETVRRLRNVAECEQFIKNVQDKYPELAIQARRKLVVLRAATHDAKTAAEREALAAVYAYEEVLSAKRGRTTRASRTWQMIKRHGIIPAIERVVCRRDETLGYTTLIKMKMQDYAFEAVVLRHRELFSPKAIGRSEERMRGFELHDPPSTV